MPSQQRTSIRFLKEHMPHRSKSTLRPRNSQSLRCPRIQLRPQSQIHSLHLSRPRRPCERRCLTIQQRHSHPRRLGVGPDHDLNMDLVTPTSPATPRTCARKADTGHRMVMQTSLRTDGSGLAVEYPVSRLGTHVESKDASRRGF